MTRSRMAVLLVLGLVGCPATPPPPVATSPAPPAPSADAAPVAQSPTARTPLALCLDHDDPRDQKCAVFESGNLCSDGAHWVFDVRGVNHRDAGTLTAMLEAEALADREKQGKPAAEPGKPKPISDLEVVIYSGPKAPWGRVQMAMNACGNAGIYKISWCGLSVRAEREAINAHTKVSRPAPIKVWLPIDLASADEPGAEVRIILDIDPDTKGVTTRVGGRFANDDGELVARLRSAGTHPSLVIDAHPKVPFGDVIHVVELSTKEGFTPQFAQPLPRTK